MFTTSRSKVCVGTFLKELKFLFIKDAEAKVTAEAFNVTRDFY